MSGEAEVRMVERCGHTLHRDQQQLVLDSAEAFIERVLWAEPLTPRSVRR